MREHARATPAVALCLYLVLLTVYLLAYSGVFHSIDAVQMFAVTENIVKHGRPHADQLWWGGEQGLLRFGRDGSLYARYPLGPSYLAAPLYWLALHVRPFGAVQAVMLLNAFLTALSGALLFLCLQRLGYGRAVGLVVALVYGLATLALVYARYFFSEPISALGLVAAAYFLLCYRREGALRWVLLAGCALGLAITAKLPNAVLVPVFAAYGFWRRERRPGPWAAPVAFGTVIAGSLLAVGYFNYARFGSPWQTGYPPAETFSTPLWEGLVGLLFTPERGLFVYLPLALLALFSLPGFFRRHRAEALLAAVVFAVYCLLFAGWHSWWGGRDWGPRFLVPTVPFLMLMLAPTVEAVLERRSPALTVAFVALTALSAAIQALGTAVSFTAYPSKVGRLVHTSWFNPDRWLILRHVALLRAGNLDLAWARGGGVDVLALGVLVVALAGVGTALVLVARRGVGRRGLAALAVGSVVLSLALPAFLLFRYRADPWFRTPRTPGRGALDLRTVPPGEEYLAMLDSLRQTARPDDAIVLPNGSYTEFTLNYNKSLAAWYALDATEPPLSPLTLRLLERVNQRHRRIWLLMDSLPAHGQPRPVERWLSQRAYKVDETLFDDYVRLCLYHTGRALDSTRPEHPIGANLGGVVVLDGYDLEETTPVAAGGLLHLSLVWRATAPVDADYTVFVQLLDGGGRRRAGADGQPVDGFRPTSSWPPGEPIRDNRVLRLPPDLPPGRYRLIAGLYRLETMERLPLLSQGAVVGDYVELGEVTVQ